VKAEEGGAGAGGAKPKASKPGAGKAASRLKFVFDTPLREDLKALAQKEGEEDVKVRP
jgi:hypothetical protein